LNKSSAKLLPIGTILLSSRATVGECSINKKECTTNQGFQSLIPKENISNEFVYYLIQTKRKDLIRKSCGSTFLEISANEVRKIVVSIPSIKEQDKIAKLLSLLDDRIATQNKIIEDLKKLKSAISHILFSSKGAIHLSEIANVVMGQSPSSNAYNDQGLGMPLVQGNLDISNGKTTPRLYTAEFNQTTEKGNIILTVRAPVGEVAKATQKVCLGRGVCAIIPHEENMSDFIYQYLTFYKFMWRRYEQGSTFTSINGSDVRNIFCPKVRNVSILTLLDIKINIEERVVKQYQSQKQYMLYQMFI
jgi:type I restriction enzyme S subunit